VTSVGAESVKLSLQPTADVASGISHVMQVGFDSLVPHQAFQPPSAFEADSIVIFRLRSDSSIDISAEVYGMVAITIDDEVR
jgi:hypothetical protein